MYNAIKTGLLYACLLLLISSCSRNPVTGKKEVMLVSSSQEKAMGDQADPSIVASFGLYQDDKLQAFINEKGKAMGKISHLPDLEYKFRVLDSPVVNAFAVPGGYVYFTRGIMAHFNNEAEFAGVLGHEIGHITARHSAKQQSSQMLGQVALIGGIIAKPSLAGAINELSQGMGLLFLKFGRDHESQSDELGVEYSTKIGYDSHEMADFFQTLQRLSAKSGQSIPDFLSTHPNPVNRYSKVHQMSESMQSQLGLSNLKVNRKEYLNRIDGIVYGEDPRQGYVDNGVFYHPELKFQFPVPYGWQLANSPTQVQMAPQDGKALMIFTLAQEKTLDAAAQAAVQNFKLNVVESQRTQVNGFPALAMVSDQQVQQDQQATQSQQQAVPRILTYFIQDNDLIYTFHGLSELNDFNTYSPSFQGTMTRFARLTDQARINVQPTRIKVQTVSRQGTLREVLLGFGTAQEDLEELAIVNGMVLTDVVPAGELIKTLSNKFVSTGTNSGNGSSSNSNNHNNNGQKTSSGSDQSTLEKIRKAKDSNNTTTPTKTPTKSNKRPTRKSMKNP